MSHIDEVHAATATAASVKGSHRTAQMNSDDNNNSSSSSYNNNDNNSFYNNNNNNNNNNDDNSDDTDGLNQYQQYQQPYAYHNYQYPVDYHGGGGGVGYNQQQQQQVAYYGSNTAAHYEMIAQNDSAGPQYYTGGGPEIDYSSMYYNVEANGVPLVQQQMDMMSIYEEQQRKQQERESLLDDFLYLHPMRNHVLRNKQRRKADLLEEVKQRINEAKKISGSSSGGGGGNSDQEKGEEHKIENVSAREQTKTKPLFPEIKNSWASVIKKSADTIATTSTTSGKSGSTVASAAVIKSERPQTPVQEKKTKTPVKQQQQQQQQAEEKSKSSGTWASMAKGDQEKGREREQRQSQQQKTKEEDKDVVNNTRIDNGNQQQPQQQTDQQQQSEQQQLEEENHGNQISTPTKEPEGPVSAKNDIGDKYKRSADPEVRERAERHMKEAMRMYEKALNPFSLPQTHEIVCTWDPMTISMWLHHYVIAPSQYQKVFVGMDCEWDILKPNIDIALTQDHLYERRDRSEDDNNSESTSQKQPRRNTGTYTGFVHAEFPDIIQISTHHSTLIYQTLGGEMHPVPELITFLSSPLIMKLCCNYSYDVRLINAWIRKHNVAAPKFDNESLLEMYGFVDIDKQGNGAPYLCSTLLERELIKDWEVVFSRWSRMYLDDDQQQYAAIDAYLNLCLYEKMNDSVKKRHSTRVGYYHSRGNMSSGFTREPREGSSSYRRHEYANNNNSSSSSSNRSGDKRVNRNFQRRRNHGGLRHGQQGADQL